MVCPGDENPLSAQLIFHLHGNVLGRRKLTQVTGASESRVRTELEKLRERGYVCMERKGTSLTEQGREVYLGLLALVARVASVSLSELGIDEFSLGALLTAPEELSNQTWYYRDLAVQQGASGAVIVEVNEEMRFLDTGEPLRKRNEEDLHKLKKTFPGWRKGRWLLLVSGSSRVAAARGLWTINLVVSKEVHFSKYHS
ncbi:MAG: hypothetical protein ACOCZX_00440 [Candidatus Bipolaricaulota bacterium]